MTESVTTSAAVVWVEGADAASFLQGLLSNDVEAVAVGGSTQALLLDSTGHIRVALTAVRTGPAAFTLVTDAAHGDRLAELLDEYHFSEDVEVIGPEPVDRVTFLAPEVEPAGADLVFTGAVPDTVDSLGDAATIRAASDAREVDAQELAWRRIAAGVPLHGVDIAERTLVHEAALERRAVSFDKGCYLGQETVARVEYRGGVKRRLRGLLLPATAAPGAAVSVDGTTIGTLGTVARHPALGWIGLAVLRTDTAAGSPVDIEGLAAPAQIADLPFPDAPTPGA